MGKVNIDVLLRSFCFKREGEGAPPAELVAQQLSAALGLGGGPGDPGWSPTSGSLHGMELASPSACVSASLSLSLFLCLMNK